MSRRKLYNLLRESVISEQSPDQPTSGGFGSGAPPAKPSPKTGAKDWDQYVKATSKGEKVGDSWELIQNNIDRIQSNSKSSPANFDNSYSGWVRWYNSCRKDKEIMSSLGKNVGAHISPAEMLVVYASFIPPKSSDKQIVSNLVGDIFNTGVKEGERIKVFRAAMLAKRAEDAKAFLESLINGAESEEDILEKLARESREEIEKMQREFEKKSKAFNKQSQEELEKNKKEFEDNLYVPDGKGGYRKKKDIKNESYRRRTKKLTRGQIRNIVESTFFRGY